jgi:RNA polymerase sigma-70 factor (ECF subfamily)
LSERLLDLWERTGIEELHRLGQGLPAHPGDPEPSSQDRADWISTCLMDAYKRTGDRRAFALLFELNQRSFLQAIQGRLRRGVVRFDAGDVLQEVFLNIYRYPHRFQADKADSFRNWGHRIVRNTLLKFLKSQSRQAQRSVLTDDFGQREDDRARSPDRAALDAESADLVDWAYLIYLTLYLAHFEQLTAKQQRALTLVELEGATYKQAAAELGIRLENLKMVIFRSRRKILRNLNQTLESLNARQSTPVSP